ncbi:MAG: BLUF domain-containing protein [Pseudomonadota bacterium]|nr:BLUF domain-containing protein [Sphingomonas sp.]MDQ3478303.1 BLUF domain-containing protein [Pseudomonadota bacterium]
MDLKTLTYTSRASLDLGARDLEKIHRTALEFNALDGVTGMLVFNGTRFLQVIEGAETAITDLLARLRRDRRHSAIEVRDERPIKVRSFPGWSMELVRVSASYFEARDSIDDLIPASVDQPVREQLLRMTESISGTVRFES